MKRLGRPQENNQERTPLTMLHLNRRTAMLAAGCALALPLAATAASAAIDGPSASVSGTATSEGASASGQTGQMGEELGAAGQQIETVVGLGYRFVE